MKFVMYPLSLLALFLAFGNVILGQAPPLEKHSRFTLPTGAQYVPGRILFKLKPEVRNVSPDAIPALSYRLQALNPSKLKRCFPILAPVNKRQDQLPDLGAIFEIYISPETDIAKGINYLLASNVLEYAEPRYAYEQLYLPNDLYADTSFSDDFMWHLEQTKALQAWDISKGDTSVVIGISDSGISFEHLDLRKNLARNAGDPIDGIDNDDDGYTDNYRGWDLSGSNGTQSDNDPSVPCSSGPCVHGVPVAGIAAADTDNFLGAAGIGFNCRYLPLKASTDSFPDSITEGYESILYGAQHGADIINCSWGGQVNSKVGADVVLYVFLRYQTGIIAACGNTPEDLAFYPASFPQVISVSNLHQGDSMCCPTFLSSTFNYAVDIGAPGWELTSSVGVDRYGQFSGTSASSPVVAGAAGLVLAHFPQYTGFQAGQRLRVTTDSIYQNQYNLPFFEKLGTGRVNILKALTDPLKPSIRLTSAGFNPDPHIAGSSDDTVQIIAQFINHLDPSTSDLAISFDITGPGSAFVEVLGSTWRPGAIGTNEAFSKEIPFAFRILPNAPENLPIDIRFSYQDPSLKYFDVEHLEYSVNTSYVNVEENLLFTSINSVGNIGYPNEARSRPGLGIQYNGNEQSALGEAGFMVSLNSMLIDNVVDETGNRNGGWEAISIIHKEHNPLADFYAVGEMRDRRGLGLEVKQEVFAWNDPDAEHFILLQYTLRNKTSNVMANVYAGILADWGIFNYALNASNYISGNRVVYSYDRTGADPVHYGIAIAEGNGFRTFAGDNSLFSYDDNSKLNAIESRPTANNSRVGIGIPVDVVQTLSGGPLVIQSRDSTVIVFALVAGENVDRLRTHVVAAEERYRCYLGESSPSAGFDSPSAPVLVGSPVKFTDRNVNVRLWHWDFGDGTSVSNIANPEHTYLKPGNYIVSGTVVAGLCEVTQKRMVQIRNSVGVEAPIAQPVLRAFPNPAEDQLTIRIQTPVGGNGEISLVDVLGKQVLHLPISLRPDAPSNMDLDISQVPAGVYIITVNIDGLSYNEKIVIKK